MYRFNGTVGDSLGGVVVGGGVVKDSLTNKEGLTDRDGSKELDDDDDDDGATEIAVGRSDGTIVLVGEMDGTLLFSEVVGWLLGTWIVCTDDGDKDPLGETDGTSGITLGNCNVVGDELLVFEGTRDIEVSDPVGKEEGIQEGGEELLSADGSTIDSVGW
jgi:hypothetical protein